jgi:hypothetical protein
VCCESLIRAVSYNYLKAVLLYATGRSAADGSQALSHHLRTIKDEAFTSICAQHIVARKQDSIHNSIARFLAMEESLQHQAYFGLDRAARG